MPTIIYGKKNINCYSKSMTSFNQILHDASHLPEDQRITLAHRLLAIAAPEHLEDINQKWDFEIQDRIARYDRGEISSRPVSEVFAELDQRLKV